MGTINDLATGAMLKPLIGATTQAPAPIRLPGLDEASAQNTTGQFTIPNPGNPPPKAPSADAQAGQASGQAANVAGQTAGTSTPLAAPVMDNGLPAPATYTGSVPATVQVSDENLKTNIKPGDEKLNNLLEMAGVHQYQYKDERDGKGTFVGPMAQELEKTEIGKSAVIDTPRGKIVDTSRLVLASLSALAMHHQEIKQVNKNIEYLKKIVSNKKAK